MNVHSRISILVATGILISSSLGLGTSCVWDPYNSETVTVGSPLTVNASPGDPAPDDQGQCACDSDNNPVDWSATGNWSVSYGGDADSSGTVDTSIGDEWTVEANIQFEYSCPETGETKMVDDPHGSWTKTYTAQSYVIDGPSSLDHDTSGSYTAQSADESPVNVTSWNAGDGVVSGSGSTVDISWSVPGQKSVTANIQNQGSVTRSVEVMGTLEVSISSPSDPAIVTVGEALTFEAADPTGGDGNYTYQWSFENGQAPAGGLDEKKVEGVKFLPAARGRENSTTLVVRDGSGNSGKTSCKVIVPVISVSSTLGDEEPLWYFKDYEDPKDLNDARVFEVTVTPNNCLPNRWQWAVSKPSKIQLSPVEGEESDVKLATATEASSDEGDCVLTVTNEDFPNISEKSGKITVDTISWGERWSANTYNVTGERYEDAYKTKIDVTFHSKFGNPIFGCRIQLKEKWLTGPTNAPGCDWPQPDEGGTLVTMPTVVDIVSGAGGHSPYPHLPSPGKEWSQDVLQYWSGQWNLGSSQPSKGSPAYWATWVRFVDHGDHWPP